jgi:hypothetical protein
MRISSLLLFTTNIINCACQLDRQRLITKLLQNYDANVRSVHNVSRVTHLTLGADFEGFIDAVSLYEV